MGPVRRGSRWEADSISIPAWSLWRLTPSPFQVTGMGALQGSVFITLIAVALGLFVLAIAIRVLRRRRRYRFVRELVHLQSAMEGAQRNSFTGRKADEIKAQMVDDGAPRTVVSGGMYVFTQSGEMLKFRSTLDSSDDGVVGSVVGVGTVKVPQPVSTDRSRPYRTEQVIALHRSGVAIISVNRTGKVERGDRLDLELLVLLEEMLDGARASPGEVATSTHKKWSVVLLAGEPMHLAALVEGEPDERLDRELRWAQGDLHDAPRTRHGPSTGEQKDRLSDLALVVRRLTSLFAHQEDAGPVTKGTASRDGTLHITSNLVLRRGALEYAIGLVNDGPGVVYDAQLLPSLGPDGALDVVSATGVDVGEQGLFTVPEIEEGEKRTAIFLFRPTRTGPIRAECTVIFLRGVADVQEVKLPVAWIEIEPVEVSPGEPIEPERVLELATQPAAFCDRLALYIPPDVETRKLMQSSTDLLRQDMRLVVQLEDRSSGRQEVWFHADLPGGATVVACLATLPSEDLLGIFVATTEAKAVAGTIVMLRRILQRTASGPMIDVTEAHTRSHLNRLEPLLKESWGDLPSPS